MQNDPLNGKNMMMTQYKEAQDRHKQLMKENKRIRKQRAKKKKQF